jgi:DNA-binding NarL/FixJ family response regulator
MTRVFIVASVRLYREGLEHALSREPSIRVVGTDSSWQEAIGRLPGISPDVTLLDCPVGEGGQAVRGISEAAPGTRVLVLAIPETESDVVIWAEAGISGYVAQDASLADLVVTIESVSRDELPCTPRMAANLLKHVAALAARIEHVSAQADLTHREHEIINLVGQGLSNKEIARALHIALPTVKNHIHNILRKLQVHRRDDAVSRLGRAVPLGTS